MDGKAAVSSSVEKCLKNTKILQRIFDHVSEDPTDNLEMRLVNRLFDAEYFHRIRRTHRNFILRFVGDGYNRETGEIYYNVMVNARVLKHKKVERYIEFLIDTVGVRVESLITSGADEFRRKKPRECMRIHDLLMGKLVKNRRLKALTGMEPMCPKGCSECVRHARTCEEYGPLQMNVYLDSYQEPRHYKKLIVSEVLLHELANQAVYLTKTKEECLEFVKVYRKPNISCSDFCLSLSANYYHHSYRKNDPENGLYFHEVFPREIIEEMCRSWKAKSARVVVCGWRRGLKTRSDWRLNNFFTEFTFGDKDLGFETKRLKAFSSLEIDIRGSIHDCYYLYYEFRDVERSSKSLIAHFRNLFPSKTVSVKTIRFPSEKRHRYVNEFFDEDIFRGILETVWERNPEKHWQLTINHVLTVPFLDFQISESYSFKNRQISCVPLPTFRAELPIFDFKRQKRCSTQYTVQPYCITDEANDCVLNLELYLETKTTYQRDHW